ncbi:MAG: hypothetical protein M5R36_06725 [Deltaproteobacteria bacterium]|nr:hypothetical protein [Deltaproteobacteria bacterium]
MIGEEVFLAAVAVFLLVIVLRLHIRLHTGMAAAGVAALVAGGVWKWLDNRSGRFFLPVALVLAFVLAPYAVFGIVGLYSQSFLVAAGGLAVFGAARWWTRNPAKALLAMILAIVACGGYASVSVLSLQWPSECEETSEAVISRGGVVSDVPGAYAILCEQNGPSLYASYPDLRRIVKIIPFEPPLIEEFEHADAATSLAIQTSTGDLIAPLIYERKLGVYNRANLGRREGARSTARAPWTPTTPRRRAWR